MKREARSEPPVEVKSARQPYVRPELMSLPSWNATSAPQSMVILGDPGGAVRRILPFDNEDSF